MADSGSFILFHSSYLSTFHKPQSLNLPTLRTIITAPFVHHPKLSPCYAMIVHNIFVLNILTRFTVKLLRNVSRPACHGKIPWKARQYNVKHIFYINYSNLHIDPLRGLSLVLAVLANCPSTCPLAALAVIVCVNS